MRNLSQSAAMLVATLSLTLLPAIGALAVDAPDGLKHRSTSAANAATDSAVMEISWNRPATLPLGYSVRATSDNAPTRTGSVYRCDESLCRSSVANLHGGVLYTFTVTAFGSSTDSASGQVTATALSAPYAATPRSQEAISDTQIRLGWSKPNSSSGEAVSSYVIRNGNTFVATTSATSVVVDGLDPLTSYTFNIAARNSIGESQTSSFNAVQTLGSAPAAPSAPTANPSETSIAISWIAPNEGSSAITDYKVYIFDNSGALVGAVRTPSPSTATSLTATGLADGTYRVAVVAVNRWGESASSSQTTVTVTSVTGSSQGSGGSAPVAIVTPPASSTTSSPTTSSPATQSTESATASGSAPVAPAPGAAPKISDFLSGGAVTPASKNVQINLKWRLVRAQVGEVLHVTIRDLAPARARVSTWARTPDGTTFRLSARTTSANGVLTSPSYSFAEPGNYKISWVYKGVKRSLVVFVSE